MEYIDYYKVLGVSKDATQDEIRRAFRKYARKYHPDVNKSEDADAQFKRINEAYEVLKDPEKRKHYDTYGKNWEQGAQGGSEPFWNRHYAQGGPGARSRTYTFGGDGSFGEAGGFSDFFKDLFGAHSAQSRDSGFRSHRYDRPGRSQEAEITVSLADVINGATKSIALQTYRAGHMDQAGPTTRNYQVKIPKGVTEGSVIRLAGQGESGQGTGAAGDLLIRIHIAPDRRFTIDGYDLHTVVHVSPWEAALGAKVPIQTARETVSLTIPKGSQSGRKLRLRGKGLPRSKDGAGDLIVEIRIRVPTNLSEAEKELFEKLSKTSKFNPRQKSTQRAAEDM
jgi:curved DNA-binding protein